MKPLFYVLAAASLVSISANAQVVAPDPPTATANAPVTQVEEPEADYVRFVEGVEKDRLQTAITRFKKGDQTVDLVGVIHLGDASYFDHLNQFLKSYDVVLYELVGAAYDPNAVDAADSGMDEMASIRQLQTMATSFLGLEYQLEGIDYEAENFVHADVKWDGLQGLMEARNQSFSEIFSRAMELSDDVALPGISMGEAGMAGMLSSLMTAVMTGDNAEFKRAIAPMLSEAESFISLLEGDDGTVLISGRNEVVMEKLAEVQRANGAGDYAVFYGAGHMPDFEERLLGMGYTKEESGWVDAWTIPAGPSTSSSSTGVQIDPADILSNLLQSNPEIIEGLQELGEMLEGLQVPE